ncbi:MAG: hypothetical protein GXY86_04650 [Firmicutes bacterium]|nr:hypothetical protein [Bacillota bacterium]
MNNGTPSTNQYVLTPAMGKRIIAKSLLQIPSIKEALQNKTVVIIAGTTNGYVAEELLKSIGQEEGFSKERFFRGITLPPNYEMNSEGRLSDESRFPGDVVIVKGKWEPGKTIVNVAPHLQKGDLIIKGANAVNLDNMQAAIYIGHPTGGTISVALQAVIGKRVELYLPVGLEKRISGDINKVAIKLNSLNANGLRYLPVSGNVITELQAINLISGAEAELVAGGGVCGAEGSCWIAVTGTEEQLSKADELLKHANQEPNFII